MEYICIENEQRYNKLKATHLIEISYKGEYVIVCVCVRVCVNCELRSHNTNKNTLTHTHTHTQTDALKHSRN